jgi:hypothetical protein
MKIVVIGGTGLIGSKTVAILRQGDHEVVAASPKSGINTITGEGVKEAVANVQVVIDLANSPSLEDKAVLEFFEISGRNLLPAEAAAGVSEIVARYLKAVGDQRLMPRDDAAARMARSAQKIGTRGPLGPLRGPGPARAFARRAEPLALKPGGLQHVLDRECGQVGRAHHHRPGAAGAARGGQGRVGGG